MLKVFIGARDDSIRDSVVDAYFDNNYYPEWFDDEIVKQMILDIDKSVVESRYCIMSPVLGQIPPQYISGGVKALILMWKTDKVVDLTACGENCAEWIVRLGDLKEDDISTDLEYEMVLVPSQKGILIENDGSVVYSKYDFIGKLIEFLP